MEKTDMERASRLRQLAKDICETSDQTPDSPLLAEMFVEMEEGLDRLTAHSAGLRDRIFFAVSLAEADSEKDTFIGSLFDQFLPNMAGEALLVNCRLYEDILPCFKVWLDHCLDRHEFERALKICSWLQVSVPSSPLLPMAIKRIREARC